MDSVYVFLRNTKAFSVWILIYEILGLPIIDRIGFAVWL
jgi:hypothetical protein